MKFSMCTEWRETRHTRKAFHEKEISEFVVYQLLFTYTHQHTESIETVQATNKTENKQKREKQK